MTRRYGRNQKRAAKARVAELEAQVSAANIATERALMRERSAILRANDARELALVEHIERSGMIKSALEDISYAMGRELGQQLKPHAEKLMASARERRPLVISAKIQHFDQNVLVLRGEIPAIYYNIAIR